MVNYFAIRIGTHVTVRLRVVGLATATYDRFSLTLHSAIVKRWGGAIKPELNLTEIQ